MYKVDERNKIIEFLSTKGCAISDWAEEPQFLAVNRSIIANTIRNNLQNTNLSEDNKKLMDCVLYLYKKSQSYFQAQSQGWYVNRVNAYTNGSLRRDKVKSKKSRKKVKEPPKSAGDKILDDVTQYLEEKQINLAEVNALMKKVMVYINEIAVSYDIYSEESLMDYTLRTANIMQQNKQEQSNKR